VTPADRDEGEHPLNWLLRMRIVQVCKQSVYRVLLHRRIIHVQALWNEELRTSLFMHLWSIFWKADRNCKGPCQRDS